VGLAEKKHCWMLNVKSLVIFSRMEGMYLSVVSALEISEKMERNQFFTFEGILKKLF
jgi:hypothetical protein